MIVLLVLQIVLIWTNQEMLSTLPVPFFNSAAVQQMRLCMDACAVDIIAPPKKFAGNTPSGKCCTIMLCIVPKLCTTNSPRSVWISKEHLPAFVGHGTPNHALARPRLQSFQLSPFPNNFAVDAPWMAAGRRPAGLPAEESAAPIPWTELYQNLALWLGKWSAYAAMSGKFAWIGDFNSHILLICNRMQFSYCKLGFGLWQYLMPLLPPPTPVPPIIEFGLSS